MSLNIKPSQIVVVTSKFTHNYRPIEKVLADDDDFQYLIKRPVSSHIFIKTLAHLVKGLELYSESFTPSDHENSQKLQQTARYDNVHILMADDHEFIRKAHARQIGKLTNQVAVCSDGAEALELFKARRGEFHLVMLDGYMPRMDGISAIRAMREYEAATGTQERARLMRMPTK